MNNDPLKLTPIDEIEDMADGVPVLAVEGTVKYAADVTRGTTKQGKDWTKQFFVLGSETADIGCSMWDAEGNELSKGEKVHIENTQNKKGQWNGMVKGSYQKDGERKHTLEIRANQVKITSNISKQQRTVNQMFPSSIDRGDSDPDWPESPPVKPHPDTMRDDRPALKRDIHDAAGDPSEYGDGSPGWPEANPISNPKPKHSMLDERQRAIIRQHSQSMALEVLKLKIGINQLILEDLTPSKLKTLADYFDNDVLEAAQ